MTLPKEPGIRRPNRAPAVAGRFYPADARECRAWAERYVSAGAQKFGTTVTNCMGGIVPHAGWICSGAIAGEAIGAVKNAMPDADLIVVFGAIHTPIQTRYAALDSYGKWIEPGGESEVVEDVRAGLSEKTGSFVIDDRFHLHEHAVEVELPLIEIAWPNAAILPIEVPLAMTAIDIGRETARRVMQTGRRAVYLASSDLTHYGPNYRFAPAGVGMQGIEWAKQNDRRLLERVEKFEVEAIVSEVATHHNACGGGAIAAMMSACRETGARGAKVLTQTNSFDTLREVAPQTPDNAVGYASVIVF